MLIAVAVHFAVVLILHFRLKYLKQKHQESHTNVNLFLLRLHIDSDGPRSGNMTIDIALMKKYPAIRKFVWITLKATTAAAIALILNAKNIAIGRLLLCNNVVLTG